MKTKKLYGKEQQPGWVVGLANKMRDVFDVVRFRSKEPGTVVTYSDLCTRFEEWDLMTVLYCLIGLKELGYIELTCSEDGRRGYATKASRLVTLNPSLPFAKAYMAAKEAFKAGDYEPEDWTEE